MLNQTTVMTLAQEVRTAQQQVTPLTPFTARIESLSFEDAYAVAYALSSLRVANGERVIGKKIGFTNPDLWAQFKVETPAWGYLYDVDTTQFNNVPLTLSLRPYYQPRIEPEIVFGLRHAPQASAHVNDLLAAIEWVALGYEMVQCHYPNWAFQVPDCIADGTFHAAMVIGERIPLCCNCSRNKTKNLLCAREISSPQAHSPKPTRLPPAKHGIAPSMAHR